MNIYTAFLRKVDTKGMSPNECWAWLGAGKGNGYGQATFQKKSMAAHKKAYLLFRGQVPANMDVCHTCDNRWCVNPDHLFLASRHANMADMVAKGRGAGGHRKHIKEHQVQEIQRRLIAGASCVEVSTQMNINYGTVTAIKRGERYVRVR